MSDVMADFTVMLDDVIGSIRTNLEMKLRLHDVPVSDFQLDTLFNDALYKDPFRDMHSEHFRNKYFKEHMMLIVSEPFKLFSHEYLFLPVCRSLKLLSLGQSSGDDLDVE